MPESPSLHPQSVCASVSHQLHPQQDLLCGHHHTEPALINKATLGMQDTNHHLRDTHTATHTKVPINGSCCHC